MNIKTSGIIVWLMGVALIVALCIMVADHFIDSRVLWLDGVVAVAAYSVALYSFTGLFRSTGEFAADMPALGVNIYTSSAYVLMAVAGIVAGLAVPLAFKWQLLLQGACIFVLVGGMLTGIMAGQRLDTVAATSQQRHQATDLLAQQAQLMKMQALSADAEVQEAIGRLATGIGMITPSQSALARQAEEQLAASMSTIARLAATDKDAALQETERATALLKQRMNTY